MSGEFDSWIGKSVEANDTIDLWQARALQNALDLNNRARLSNGDALPALWHWAYFKDPTVRSEQGYDGHPAKGGFLPPIPLPRRMWARGNLTWHHPLCIGHTYRKVSTISDIVEKVGRSGPLVFVVVDHNFFDETNTLCLTEQHHIVYREAVTAPHKQSTANPVVETIPSYDWNIGFTPDPVLLFRYSALTYNGHRIHYDLDFVKNVEGYPGLIVHGPLLATLALEQIKSNKPEATVRSFDFKMLSPVFLLSDKIHLCGNVQDSLINTKIHTACGTLALDGTAELAPF